MNGPAKRHAPGPVDTVGQSVSGTLAALSSNPNGLFAALTDLKHAVELGQITQGQLSEIHVLATIVVLLDL